MKNLIILILISAILLMHSCNSSSNNIELNANNDVINPPLEVELIHENNSEVIAQEPLKTILNSYSSNLGKEIIFEDISIYFDSMDIYVEEGVQLKYEAKDSPFQLDLDLGENISNIPVVISSLNIDEYESFQVLERGHYVYALGMEGPHCECSDKEIFSDWIPLTAVEFSNKFKTLTYEDFPPVQSDLNYDQFAALVTEMCHEGYIEYIEEYYPEDLEPSNYLSIDGFDFKIVAIKKDGSQKELTIISRMPMGC